MFYLIMFFVVIAIAAIIGWALNDKDGWLIDENEPWEWREKEDDDGHS